MPGTSMRTPAILSSLLLLMLAVTLVSREPQADARLKNGFRRPEKSGWTFVHLEGTPAEIGYQHGYLLAPEIRETFKVTQLEITHDNNTYTVIVAPVGRGFQSVLFRRLNPSVVLRFVTPDGKELQRWDESAPPQQFNNTVPPGTRNGAMFSMNS